jgi:hypothetical protein
MVTHHPADVPRPRGSVMTDEAARRHRELFGTSLRGWLENYGVVFVDKPAETPPYLATIDLGLLRAGMLGLFAALNAELLAEQARQIAALNREVRQLRETEVRPDDDPEW